MTYLYAFNIKINKQAYNKILYEFCKLYENKIIAITYEIKKKIYNIIVEVEDVEIINEMELKTSEMFKDLIYNKDYETEYILLSEFIKLYNIIYFPKLSCDNPKMYLYINETFGKFKIEYTPLFIFDVLYKFKISDMDEIICWNMIFYNCLTNKDYGTFIIWCIIRYWDNKYKFINIHKMNGFCSKNERIPKDVKKYIDYCKCEKDLDNLLEIEAEKLYINITQIPYVFNVIFFMKKLEKEAKVNGDYKDFDIINYETMIKEIKEMKKTKKTLKTIQENKEMEIVEYDLDYDLDILFSMDKEDSIIENIIFDNKEEDEEYFEIMRTRRIKKSFMIN